MIAGQARPDVASYGCLVLLMGILPAWLLGDLGAWLGGLFSPGASGIGQWIGWGIAAALLIAALITFIPFERRQSGRAALDGEASLIEELHVTDPRVIEIGLIGDNEPILAFDIGGGKLLYLQGQWLRHTDTYGVAHLTGDGPDEYLNCLPPPNSFPSTEFTVSRFPHSGEVTGIRVAGQYLTPEREVEALKPEYEFGSSEVFSGSLDNIADVLAREHRARKSR